MLQSAPLSLSDTCCSCRRLRPRRRRSATSCHEPRHLRTQPIAPLNTSQTVRDKLKAENAKLQQQCGLIGNEPLLRDFEHVRDETADLAQHIEV